MVLLYFLSFFGLHSLHLSGEHCWLTGKALLFIRCNISLVHRQTSSDLHQQELCGSKTCACAEIMFIVLNLFSLTQTKILNRLSKAFYGEEVDGSSFTPHTVR